MPEKKSRGSDARLVTLPRGEIRQEENDFSIVRPRAPAGGLDAFQKFLDGMPADNGMAFVFIQPLDPTHDSRMVELLAQHTEMTVRQAVDKMPIEDNCVYVIPPGRYLSVLNGTLHLSQLDEPHGSRLPFTYLPRSLAVDWGDHAICVVLSGTGADVSPGAKAAWEGAGLVARQVDDLSGDETSRTALEDEAKARFASLTPRQHEILMMILAGHPNKNISADLGISQRTVENHRATIMKKTGCRSLAVLARLAFAAGLNPDSQW